MGLKFISNLIALTSILPIPVGAKEFTNPVQRIVEGFITDYRDVEMAKYKKIYEKKSFDVFCVENGFIDLNKKLIPALKLLERRYKSADDIPKTDFKEDLGVIVNLFISALKLGYFHKDVLKYNIKNDPGMKNLSEDGKMALNRSTLTSGLLHEFCNIDMINRFPSFLHDSIIHDFTVLGLDGLGLNDIKTNLDAIFKSLKSISEILQKYIVNEHLKENLSVLTESTVDPGYAQRFGLWIIKKAGYGQESVSAEILDKSKISDIENMIKDEFYKACFTNQIELYYKMLLLLIIDSIKSKNPLSKTEQAKYIKAFSDIGILSYLCELISNIPKLAKSQEMVPFINFYLIVYGNIVKIPMSDLLTATTKETAMEEFSMPKSAFLALLMEKIKPMIDESLKTDTPSTIPIKAESILRGFDKFLLVSTYKVNKAVEPEEILKEAEIFSYGPSEVDKLYLIVIPQILNILANGQDITTITQEEILKIVIYFRFVSINPEIDDFSDKIQSILKHVDAVINKPSELETDYTTYAKWILGLLIIVDGLLLVIFWSKAMD